MNKKYVVSFVIFLLFLTQASCQKLATFGRAKPQVQNDEPTDSQPKLKTFGSLGGTSTPQSTNFYTRNRSRWWWFPFLNWLPFFVVKNFAFFQNVTHFDQYTTLFLWNSTCTKSKSCIPLTDPIKLKNR